MILLIAGLAPFNAMCQYPSIDSCMQRAPESMFCSSYTVIASDSIFVHTRGCERHQSIQVGKMSQITDTVYLKKLELNFESIFDSIVFVTDETQEMDTIDLFYYDRYGNHSHSDRNFISYFDSINSFVAHADLRKVDVPRFEDVSSYSRTYDYFVATGEPFPDDYPYYGVDNTYITSTDRKLGLFLYDFYDWTGIKKVIPIPENTSQIKIYYTLTDCIISLLTVYGAPISHDVPVIIYECGETIYKIE
jgi:hypothetical protein